VKCHSGSRIAFFIVALLVTRVGANAKGHHLLLVANPASGNLSCWHAVTHYNRGLDLQIKGDLEGAITEYRTVIKRRKKSPEAHYSLGHALQGKGDLEGAIVEYRTAISQRPNYPEAQSAVAEALKARDKS
jgi:tetratricopeptide (TPR) repeat protein